MRKLIPVILLFIPFFTLGQTEGPSTAEVIILPEFTYGSNSLFIKANKDSSFQYSILDMENNQTIMTGKVSTLDPLIRTGRYTFYTPTGAPFASGYYSNNIPYRSWSFFDADGQVISSVNYTSAIQFLNTFGNIEIGSDFVTLAKKAPRFRRKGITDFLNFIKENAVYPPFSLITNEEGRVTCQFVIDKTGQLINVKILEGVNEDLDMEVIRILSLSPLWKPGKIKGKPVNVMYTIPIHFKINAETQ